MAGKRKAPRTIKVESSIDGQVIIVEVSSAVGLLGVHECTGARRGYTLTHVPTGRPILATRLKRDARGARDALEAMSWGDLGAVRVAVGKLVRAEVEREK